jgi:hypothetical protein
MSYSGSGRKQGGALEAFYGGYAALGGYTGGADKPSVLGPHTGTGFHSAAKKHLIKDLAHILSRLGMEQFKGVEDVDEILKLMRSEVPDPRKGKGNKKSWGKDKASQVKVCKTIAAAINERAPGLVDVKANPDELCSQISEVVTDLFGGLSAELLQSRENLEKALKNLRTLKKFLEDNFKTIEGKIQADQDSTVKAETSAARSLHHDLLEEVDRHLAKLQLMIDTVVQPSELELAELERDNEEFRHLIKKINKDFGTREAGRKVSYTLSGFVTAVEAARIVDKALGRLGLSLKEYDNAKEFKDLKELLSSKDLAALSKDEVNLDLYEKAKQELLKLHYLHDDVVEALKSKHGGLFNPIANGGDASGGLFNPIANGGLFNPIANGGDAVTGGLKLDKRVKRRQDLKRALINDFNNKLAQFINIILISAKAVASALADGKAEMSDAVQKFVKALESLEASNSLTKSYTYFAVAGILDDIRAREEREKFISNCKYIISTIDDVLKENKLGHLKDMRDAFQRIIELIEAYVAKFAEGFGPLESWEQYSKEIRGADEAVDGAGIFGDFFYGKKSDDPEKTAERDARKAKWGEVKDSALDGVSQAAAAGAKIASKAITQGLSKHDGAAESFLGGAGTATMARIAGDLKDAINTISYYNRIALMRRGLDKASKELKSYKDDYGKILADAVANQRDKNTTARNKFITTYERDGSLNKKFIASAAAAPHPAAVTAAEAALALGPGVVANQTTLDAALKAAVDSVSSDDKAKINASFDKARSFGLGMYDAVDNIYKVAEAMDIYMKEFTDGISAHPDDVQNIIKILDDTEIISKWFDDKSGDFLCKVFDSFPGYYENGVPKYNNLNNKLNQIKENNHYYLRISSVLNLGRPAILKDQGHEDDLKLGHVLAAGSFAVWNGIAHKQKIGAQIGASINRLPGNPYLSTLSQFSVDVDNALNTENAATAALEYTQKAMKQVSSLKNLVAAFVTIGDKFGGKEMISKTNISPKLLLQYLNDYIVYSSFKLGFEQNNANVGIMDSRYNLLQEPSLVIPTGTISANAAAPDGALNLGLNSGAYNGAPSDSVRRHLSVIMRSCEDSVEELHAGDMFEDPDKIFKLVVKAMIAKILTVIGTFNMFNRPVNYNGLGYYSDLRLILGGAEHPTVIPEAFELYIRLPLLAEFYREVFNFDEKGVSDPTISMVPEMDGTFSELIALIFDKARTVTDGNYSDTETRMLVEIINKIYGRFKNSKSPVRDCIEEFVAEVNRRYGVVKAEERNRYLQERRDRYKTKYNDPADVVDFELKAIDEDDTFVRPSPSDQYRTVGANPASAAKNHKYELRIDDDQTMITKLRTKIDAVFKRCQARVQSTDELQALRNITFQHMINARRHELKHATSDKHRYEIVRNAIASLGTFAISSLERSYILFHETVVSGLSALRLLYNSLSKYENKVRSIWSEYNTYSSAVASGGALPAPGAYAGVGVGANIDGNNGVPMRVLAIPAGTDPDLAKDAQLRFGLNQRLMFADLFEALYNHGETLTDLIEVKIDVSRNEDKFDAGTNTYTYGQRKLSAHIDYSKLREHVYALFNSVKSMLDKFRGLLPDKVLERYEKYDADDTTGQGASLYWIEKKLLDELLEGRYEDEVNRNNTLDGSNKKIRELLDYFTHPWKVSGYMVANNNYGAKVEIHANAQRNFKDTTQHQFMEQLVEILYNTSIPAAPAFPPAGLPGPNAPAGPHAPAGIAAAALPAGLVKPLPVNTGRPGALAGLPASAVGILKLLYNTSGKAKAGKQPGERWDGVDGYLDLYPKTQDEWNINTRNDLVISFNKLIAAYIAQIYDEPSRTIYLPTINKFAAGALSASIMGASNYNDNRWNNSIIFSNGEFKSVLFRSLAVCLRQLIAERNIAGSEPEFAKSDLAQVPTYVKERLRANLPVFRKLFTLLMERSELAKKFAVALDVEDQNVTIVAGGPSNDKDVENIFLNGFDQITHGCNSIIQCIDDALTDLADSPKFFETSADSIQNYENINGVHPFMPTSSILNILQDNMSWDFGMPIGYLGNDGFKLLYGTRGVLNKNKHTLAETPSLINCLKDHNNTVDPRHHVAEKDLQEFNDRYLLSVKYLADAQLYAQQFTLQNAGVPRFDLKRATQITGDKWVYQLKSQVGNTNLTEVLRLTESNFQREERNKIVNHVERGDDPNAFIGGKRDDLVACNIVDMNIVPINLHALMREIPLVNLYNYAYTYDKLINEVLGDIGDIKETDGVYRFKDVKRPDKMLALLMLNPYLHLDESAYEFLVGRIFRGALGVEGLGRPKYLGDEVFNKSLFGEIYGSETDKVEPDAALAASRRDGHDAAFWEQNKAGAQIEAATGQGAGFGDQFIRDILSRKLNGRDDAAKTAMVNQVVARINTALGLAGPQAHDDALRKTLLNVWNDKDLFKRRPRSDRANTDESVNASSSLYYLVKDTKNKAQVHAVDVDHVKEILKCWGKLRFDTRLIRNIFWITNLQRVLRLKLRRDLTWYNSKVVSDHAVVASGITELYDHDMATTPNMFNYQY